MENSKLKNWCETAVSRIRYRPDRKEVEAELMAHMEDKRDALRQNGIPENELEDAVLRSMGSAEEIAPQLAAIHKPFWGYVYTATTCLVLLLAAIVLFLGNDYLLSHGTPRDYGKDTSDNFDILAATHEEIVLDYAPHVSAQSNGYTYTVTRVGMWKTDWDSWTEYECMFRILITGLYPWESRHSPIEYFWAEDSLGNRYISYTNYMHQLTGKHTQIFTPTEGFLSATYDVILRCFDAPNAQWIKLHYDRDGRNIVLHIDLTGGDGQ